VIGVLASAADWVTSNPKLFAVAALLSASREVVELTSDKVNRRPHWVKQAGMRSWHVPAINLLFVGFLAYTMLQAYAGLTAISKNSATSVDRLDFVDIIGASVLLGSLTILVDIFWRHGGKEGLGWKLQQAAKSIQRRGVGLLAVSVNFLVFSGPAIIRSLDR
jgi:hypothetical protein